MTGPRLIVGLATWLLPSWARDRYAVEFHAELVELGRGRRWSHALTVLAMAYALRIAVLRATAVGAGFEHPPLHCLMGFAHVYRTASTDDGQRYQRCHKCGIDDHHLGRKPTDWAIGLQLGSLISWQ